MGNGKRGQAPCGHLGECIIGQFYNCLVGCDGEADWNDITLEIPRCPNCKSLDVEDYELDPIYYLFNPGSTIIIDSRCIDCGHCWLR